MAKEALTETNINNRRQVLKALLGIGFTGAAVALLSELGLRPTEAAGLSEQQIAEINALSEKLESSEKIRREAEAYLELHKRIKSLKRGGKNPRVDMDLLAPKPKTDKEARVGEIKIVEVVHISLGDDIQAIINEVPVPTEKGGESVEIKRILILEPGTYDLSETGGIDIINRPIELRCDTGRAIFDCKGQCYALKFNGSGICTHWEKMKAKVEGVDIINGIGLGAGGIERTIDTNLILEDVTFNNCHGYAAGAMYGGIFGYLTITNVTVTNCSSGASGGGIRCIKCFQVHADGLTIRDCEGNGMSIENNSIEPYEQSIVLRDVDISDCTDDSHIANALFLYSIQDGPVVIGGSFTDEDECGYAVGIDNCHVIFSAITELDETEIICDTDASYSINQTPISEADTARIVHGATDPITIDVLSNDSPGETEDTLTLTKIVTAPEKGSAAIEGNQIVYTPPTGGLTSEDEVTFTYEVQDELEDTDTAEVTITVTIGEEGDTYIYLPLVFNNH